MIYLLLAEALVLLHFAYVLFVVGGGLLVLRRPRLARVHLPCVLWSVLVEITGWICPLTPWEKDLRVMAGRPAYDSGFLDHYLAPILYPAGLTREIQVGLGVALALLNLTIYGLLWRRRRRS